MRRYGLSPYLRLVRSSFCRRSPPPFFAILFLQSGSDKVIDRRGNLNGLRDTSRRVRWRECVGLLLGIITIMELAAGALSAIGCVTILLRHDSTIAFYGVVCGHPPRTFSANGNKGLRRGRLAAFGPGRDDRARILPRARVEPRVGAGEGLVNEILPVLLGELCVGGRSQSSRALRSLTPPPEGPTRAFLLAPARL